MVPIGAAFAQDILFDGWDFIGTLEHDVGTGFAGQFGVFMNGLSSDGNLDLHRWVGVSLQRPPAAACVHSTCVHTLHHSSGDLSPGSSRATGRGQVVLLQGSGDIFHLIMWRVVHLVCRGLAGPTLYTNIK